MKTSLKTLILSSVVVLAMSDVVIAREFPTSPQEQFLDSIREYWGMPIPENLYHQHATSNPPKELSSGKKITDEEKTSEEQKELVPEVSAYPCIPCEYSHKLGGYVPKDFGK